MMAETPPPGPLLSASRTLTTAEAKAFYDGFGAKQDAQAFYEDLAVKALIDHADFGHAHSVFEFGSGTGRLAARLLGTMLPDDCRYLGVDISETMVALARERLRPWATRAEVVLSEGPIPTQCRAAEYDRFVSTYVLDLMSEEAIGTVLADANRLLCPDGLLCLVSLTHGDTFMTKLVVSAWTALHRLNPKIVGGCRPIALHDLLPGDCWQLRHHEVVSAWGINSEVLVAARTP